MFEIMSVEMVELYILYKKWVNLYNVFNSLSFQQSNISYIIVKLISDINERTLKALFKYFLRLAKNRSLISVTICLVINQFTQLIKWSVIRLVGYVKPY